MFQQVVKQSWKITTVARIAQKVGRRTFFHEVKRADVIQPTIPIQGREFLPGSQSKRMPKYIPKNWSDALKVIECDASLKGQSLTVMGEELRKYIDKSFQEDSSAILLKDTNIRTAQEFEKLGKGLNFRPMNYAAGAGYRKHLHENVYTASDEPESYTIEGHNEMSYMENFPQIIMFCCVSQAENGGENSIVFNRDLMCHLDPEWVEKARTKGIRYHRNVPHEDNSSYITWQKCLETKSVEIAEDRLKKQSLRWDWQENGDLTLWNKKNAFIKNPRTKEEVWFNQITLHHCSNHQNHPYFYEKTWMKPFEYPYHATYGDGEEFEPELLENIRTVSWHHAVPLKLEAGDLLILDNLLVQHTKMGFSGGNRKYLLQLCEPMNDNGEMKTF